MNATDIIGYAREGDIYCLDCSTEDDFENGWPVFADTEFIHVPVCGECLFEIDEANVID